MNIKDLLDIEQLEDILKNWSESTSLAAVVIDSDGEYIATSTNSQDFLNNIADGTMDFNRDIIIAGEKAGSITGGQLLPNKSDFSLHSDRSFQASVDLLESIINALVNARSETSSSVSNIDALDSEIERASNLIREINEKSFQLDKIENKQNILSLNASIEAARAGELGRGFAVVAAEVGKLAVNSGEINKSIKHSLKELTEAIKSLQKLM